MIGARRAATWFGFLVGSLVGLRLAATGALAAPPLGSLSDLETWVDARGPVTVAVALVRSGAEAATWYLLALSVLHAASSTLRLPVAAGLADALAGPTLGRAVRGALGVGLVVSGTGHTGAPFSTPVAAATAPMAERASGTATQQPLDRATATMRPVVEQVPGTARMAPVSGPAEPPRAWRVESGDSFWSIAAETLEMAWHRPPTDREIDPFWRALVDANRDRLVVGGDPDLVVPGQVFDVPAVPATDP